jgi:hypothetical protein
MARPDPFREIRLMALTSIQGVNFWSRSSVTRADLTIGAYDEISSAEVAGFTERLLAALPGLEDHRCSTGKRGGFVERLRKGTYAAHIVEHVALELQSAIGHEVGFGRARGGETPGEYMVVHTQLHSAVGLRAAARALEIVQCAFAEQDPDVDGALLELRLLARQPDPVRPRPRIWCAVTGSTDRATVRNHLRTLRRPDGPVLDVEPAYILHAGLPYAASDLAIILDADPAGVPERFRHPEPYRKLLAVVAEAVEPEGTVIVAAEDLDLQESVRQAKRAVALFTAGSATSAGAAHDARATAVVRHGEVRVERRGELIGRVPLTGRLPPAAEAATTLAMILAEAPELLLRKRTGS